MFTDSDRISHLSDDLLIKILSLVPVKHLTNRFYYYQLLHMELHIYQNFRSNLLLRVLQDTPKLQVIKLNQTNRVWFGYINKHPCLVSEPSYVPECLSFHLETLQWIGYGGSETKEEKEAAVYILRNGRRLKSALISLTCASMKNGMITIELQSVSKALTSCELVIQRSNVL